MHASGYRVLGWLSFSIPFTTYDYSAPSSSGIHGFGEAAGSNPLKCLHPPVSPPDLEGFSLTFCSSFMVCPFEDCFYLSSLFWEYNETQLPPLLRIFSEVVVFNHRQILSFKFLGIVAHNEHPSLLPLRWPCIQFFHICAHTVPVLFSGVLVLVCAYVCWWCVFLEIHPNVWTGVSL